MGMEWLSSVAPVIATALGGPLAGAAAQFIAGKLGVSDTTIEAMQRTLSGMSGADLVRLKEIDADLRKFFAANGIQLELAQIEVNREEAKSTNWFVAGWRPAVGWIGAAALAYAAIGEPLARFIAQVLFDYAGVFPQIDTTITMQVLFGLLGLGAFRSIEKVKHSEGNRS